MKKLLIRLLIGLVVVVIIVVVAIGLFLDSAIKKGVETVGPKVTKVDVKLDGVSLSLLSGSGKIKGFVLGNPPGYQTPHAISVGSASVSIQPSSIFSDKVVIKSIRIESPEITYEGGLGGDNLHAILNNVTAASSSGTNATTQPGKPAKKLQVDDFVITGAKVNVSLKGMGGFAAPVTLPEIHLFNLGQSAEGITSAELTHRVLNEVIDYVMKYGVNKAIDIGKGALDKTANEGVNKATEKLGDLFKKKKQ